MDKWSESWLLAEYTPIAQFHLKRNCFGLKTRIPAHALLHALAQTQESLPLLEAGFRADLKCKAVG